MCSPSSLTNALFSERTIFVCVCLLFVHYTPGLFLHNMILGFSEQCPWRITHFSWAVFPMVFRRSYFHPLQSFSAFSCLSLKDRNYKRWKDIFSTCFASSQPGIPLHTKNWGLEHIFPPASSRALHPRVSPGGGRRREAKVTPFQAEVPPPAHPSFPRTGGCGRGCPARLSEGSPAAQLTPLRSTLSMCQSASVMTVKCHSSLSVSVNVPFCPAPSVPLLCSVSMWSCVALKPFEELSKWDLLSRALVTGPQGDRAFLPP